MSARIVAGVLAVGLGGCQLLVGIDDTAPGTVAVDGAVPGDALTLLDGHATADATPTGAACGGLRLLADEFDDGDPWPLWSCSDPAAITEDAGLLRFQVAPNGAGNLRCTSRLRYDLRDESVSVGLAGAVPVPAYVHVVVFADSGEAIRFALGDGLLRFERIDSIGVQAVDGPIQYDPFEHAWWRLRRAGEELLWETSADGGAWRERARTVGSLGGHVASAGVALEVGTVAASPIAVDVAFGAVNAGARPLGGYCPARALEDGFDRSELGDDWIPCPGDGCLPCEGAVCVTASPGSLAPDRMLVQSAHAYDLCDQNVSLRAVGMSAPITALRAVFEVESLGGGAARFAADATHVTEETRARPSGAWAVHGELDTALPAAWTIGHRGSSGMVEFDTGLTFLSQLAPPSFDCARVVFQFGLERTDLALDPAGLASFDDLATGP